MRVVLLGAILVVAVLSGVVWLLGRLNWKNWLALGVTVFVVVPIVTVVLAIAYRSGARPTVHPTLYSPGPSVRLSADPSTGSRIECVGPDGVSVVVGAGEDGATISVTGADRTAMADAAARAKRDVEEAQSRARREMQRAQHEVAEAQAKVEDVMNRARAQTEQGLSRGRPAPAATPGWDPQIELDFPADVYPSQASAAKALARWACKAIEGPATAHVEPPATAAAESGTPAGPSILITSLSSRYGGGEVAPAAVNALAEAMRSRMPLARIDVDAQPMDTRDADRAPEGRDFAVQLSIAESYSRSDGNETGGDIVAKVMAKGHVFNVPTQEPSVPGTPVRAGVGGTYQSRGARFCDKPWVEGFAAYKNGHPQALMAWTPQPEADAAEAERSAVRRAVQLLLPDFEDRVQSLAARAGMARRFDEPDKAKVLSEAITTGQLRVDTFTQGFARPYGVVWRHAILLDRKSDVLDELARRCVAEGRRVQAARYRSWAGQGGAMVGLVLLTLIVYLFLNAATRGYYVWCLRCVILIVITVGALVILNFA